MELLTTSLYQFINQETLRDLIEDDDLIGALNNKFTLLAGNKIKIELLSSVLIW